MLTKEWPPRKAAIMTNTSSYQRKIVILWMYAVMEPLPLLVPSSWKLISRSPFAQPSCSAEVPTAPLNTLCFPSTFTQS